jgi:DNA-binding transcriptional ArsR family regulator
LADQCQRRQARNAAHRCPRLSVTLHPTESLTLNRISGKILFMARPYNTPDVFRAIAHPVRRRMLDMLRKGPMTAAELAQPFHMTMSSISEHIRALRLSGLIDARSRGPQHVYAIVRARLRPIEEWIGDYQRKA